METVLRSSETSVVVSPDRPTGLIGEKISAADRSTLAEALRDADRGPLCREAEKRVGAGADVLEVNIGAPDVNEIVWLPRAVPMSIDTVDFKALEAALATHREHAPEGKPLIDSVNGEERYLEAILPLAANHRAAVGGMALDDDGTPELPEARVTVARKIIERAEREGVPPEGMIIDCMALSMSTDPEACRVTLEAIRRVRGELGVNLTPEPCNVSFGLPERDKVDWAFTAMAIQNGVNCPIVDVTRDHRFTMTVDVILGEDLQGFHLIESYRVEHGEDQLHSQPV